MREDNRDGTTAARTALNMEARGMEASRVRSGHGRQPSESQEVADVFSASFRTHVGAEPAFQGTDPQGGENRGTRTCQSPASISPISTTVRARRSKSYRRLRWFVMATRSAKRSPSRVGDGTATHDPVI